MFVHGSGLKRVILLSDGCGNEGVTDAAQYLHACADNANRAPADLDGWLPWTMDAARLADMRAVHTGSDNHHGIDSS